jgi:hypothetical protein
VRELNDRNKQTSTAPALTGKARQFAVYAYADNACSSCYASLIFALSRLGKNGLNRIRGKICMGQGFKGKNGGANNGDGASLGVGQCTSGFSEHCPGCPPSGTDILDFIKRRI